jgi:prepilin-type processing-associated H-X9-DG protein
MPALSAARAASRQTVCLSNLRQIGLAELMYINENKGFCTYGGTYSAAVTGGTRFYGWFGSYMTTSNDSFIAEDGMLFPYLQTATVSGCPDHNSDTRLYYGPVDYAFNAVYMGNCPTGGSVAPFLGAKINKVREPSRTAMFWDSNRMNGTTLERTFIGYPTSYGKAPYSQLQWHIFSGRHKGGTGNIVWADGHGSGMKPWQNPNDSTSFPPAFIKANLGDIDEDNDSTTDELYTLQK